MGKKTEMGGNDNPGNQDVPSSSGHLTGNAPVVFVARERMKYQTEKDVLKERQCIEIRRHMSGKQAPPFSAAAACRYRYPILFSWAVDG